MMRPSRLRERRGLAMAEKITPPPMPEINEIETRGLNNKWTTKHCFASDVLKLNQAWMKVVEESIEKEREACAVLCNDMVLYTGFDCANAIRNRS